MAEIKKESMKAYELYLERKKAEPLIKYIIKKHKVLDKDKFWEIVKDLDRALKYLYPKEYASIIQYVKEERESQLNQFGSDKEHSIRHLVAVPISIWGTLKYLYGKELPYDEQGFQREFAKRLPHYRIAEKI